MLKFLTQSLKHTAHLCIIKINPKTLLVISVQWPLQTKLSISTHQTHGAYRFHKNSTTNSGLNGVAPEVFNKSSLSIIANFFLLTQHTSLLLFVCITLIVVPQKKLSGCNMRLYFNQHYRLLDIFVLECHIIIRKIYLNLMHYTANSLPAEIDQ